MTGDDSAARRGCLFGCLTVIALVLLSVVVTSLVPAGRTISSYMWLAAICAIPLWNLRWLRSTPVGVRPARVALTVLLTGGWALIVLASYGLVSRQFLAGVNAYYHGEKVRVHTPPTCYYDRRTMAAEDEILCHRSTWTMGDKSKHTGTLHLAFDDLVDKPTPFVPTEIFAYASEDGAYTDRVVESSNGPSALEFYGIPWWLLIPGIVLIGGSALPLNRRDLFGSRD